MIVLDASAAVPYLIGTRAASAVEEAIGSGPVHVPVHFDVEVYGAVRRELMLGHIDLMDALNAMYALRLLIVQRHPVTRHLMDALALRDNIGAHDVFYVLLARRLGATFVTCDGPLSRAAAPYCQVSLIAA
ncbi:MAG: type II toxin-antitoxin system VapC family toxin [Chloroflexota bacterium]